VKGRGDEHARPDLVRAAFQKFASVFLDDFGRRADGEFTILRIADKPST
jgi:hypothetical protein